MKDKLKNWFTGFVLSAIGSFIFFFGAYSIVAFIFMIISTGWESLLNFVLFVICVVAFIKLPQLFVKELEWWSSVRQPDNNDSTKE